MIFERTAGARTFSRNRRWYLSCVALATPLTANRPPGVGSASTSSSSKPRSRLCCGRDRREPAGREGQSWRKQPQKRARVVLPFTRGRATGASAPSPTNFVPAGSSASTRRSRGDTVSLIGSGSRATTRRPPISDRLTSGTRRIYTTVGEHSETRRKARRARVHAGNESSFQA